MEIRFIINLSLHQGQTDQQIERVKELMEEGILAHWPEADVGVGATYGFQDTRVWIEDDGSASQEDADRARDQIKSICQTMYDNILEKVELSC
jgi:hypothetical protein